ncbi:MAG: hypothetical protein AAF660_00025 [Pseudomonadota bacterium]
MRTVLLLLISSSAVADYTETRQLSESTDGVSVIEIDASAGTLSVTGSDTVSDIVVEARIKVEGMSEKKATDFIENKMRLVLERSGETLRLVSDAGNSGWNWNSQGYIDLDVQVPNGIDLVIDDSSGHLRVQDVQSHIKVDDSSGSVDIINVGSLYIDDGSGSIEIRQVSGDVEVDDGSGSMKIYDVGGSVTIDDGSGSITVRSVAADLNVIDDGSGSVDFSDIGGSVSIDD